MASRLDILTSRYLILGLEGADRLQMVRLGVGIPSPQMPEPIAREAKTATSLARATGSQAT
jgi:hypothetical protein